MISLKDYAKQKNISYEAVRQQVNRYREDLGEHIQKVGRSQFLDDEAVAFLDERREKNPVIVMEMDKDSEIEQLKNENKALLIELASVNRKLNEVRDKLDEERDKVHQLEAEKIKLLEEGHIAVNEDKVWWKFWKR